VFKSLRGRFSYDLAVDLGTANSLIYVRGRGIVLNEPSVIAIRQDHDSSDPRGIAAVGERAKRMIGRAPGSISVIRPLRDGVIANFTITQAMLKYFIRAVHEKMLFHPSPRILVGVPSGSTQVERRAIRESAMGAGARDVFLIEEPLAAAMGAGIPIETPMGWMVLDIGGGTAEVAVLSLNGIVYAESARAGGDRLDEVIINYVRRHYGTVIGESTAERIKLEVGSAFPAAELKQISVHGGNLAEGLPRRFSLNSNEILEAIQEPLAAIVAVVRRALERTPPELASDIVGNGLVLTGGGALLVGLDRLITEETGIPVRVAEDPLSCVARGAGRALDHLDDRGMDLFLPD
jgi:rod shape-determining protein MreB and related proteins